MKDESFFRKGIAPELIEKYKALSYESLILALADSKSEQDKTAILAELGYRRMLKAQQMDQEELRRRAFDRFVLHPEDITWIVPPMPENQE